MFLGSYLNKKELLSQHHQKKKKAEEKYNISKFKEAYKKPQYPFSLKPCVSYFRYTSALKIHYVKSCKKSYKENGVAHRK